MSWAAAFVPVLLAATPSPSGTSRVLDETQVTPGLIGFLATFGIVLATVFLVIDMTRRVRRLRYRQRVVEARQAEARAARAAAADNDE